MTQFSSGKHEKLTADPEPHINGHLNRQAHPFVGQCCTTRFAPRAFYDRPLTNPANPILSEFRNIYRGISPTTPERIARYLRYIGDPLASSEDDPSWTQEQREHARAVLTRIAKFKELIS